MGRHRLRVGGLCALLACAACDLTLPWASGSTPPSPSLAVSTLTFDVAYLTWSDQRGVEGWELEGRCGSDPWGPPPGFQIAPTAWYVPLAGLPELTSCAFRIRSVVAGSASAWVEAGFLHGIRAPTGVSVTGALGSDFFTLYTPLTVHWGSASAVATEVAVERRPRDAAGAPWITVPGASLAADAVLDASSTPGVAYTYRVRLGAAGVWSDAVETSTGAAIAGAPYGVDAEWIGSGVRVSWSGPGTGAMSTRVIATADPSSPLQQTFDLPGAPTGWEHAGSAWPGTSYCVQYLYGPYWTSSEWARLRTFRLDGPPALDASAVALPATTHGLARDDAGRFHATDGVGAFSVYRATPSGWDVHAVPDAQRAFSPGLLLDAAGNPHVVYEQQPPGWDTVPQFVHEYWNGSGWDAEVIRTGVRSVAASFALGPGGAVHLVYSAAGADSTYVHVLRSAGTTVENPLPAFADWGVPVLAATGDGLAVVARVGYEFGVGNTVVVQTRALDGSWSEDPVPIGTLSTSGVRLAAGLGGDVAVAYGNTATSPLGEVVSVIRRSAGVWSAPEDLFTRTRSGGSDREALAGTADLTKLVLSATGDGRTRLFVRAGDAGWEGVEVGPTAPPAWVGVGPSGAWAVYDVNTWVTWGTTDFALFVEPPPP